jgi:NAD(P)H dehydrogenase (quinone)
LTTSLTVLAHPERRSFNGAWAAATARACEGLGHEVLRSDLVQMQFDPVEAAVHYRDLPTDQPFDPLQAQETAAAAGTLPDVVSAEIDKLRRADLVFLHFPLWWFAPPAVLKGWLDRVFAHGAMHDTDRRFDRGRCRGKTVLFCVTTGSSAAESAFNGKEGDIGMLLWPMAYAFRYLGFSVLVPEIVHGVHGYHKGPRQDALRDRLRQVLARQDALVAGIATRPALRFNADDDFDAEGRLKPDCPIHSWFIRQDP